MPFITRPIARLLLAGMLVVGALLGTTSRRGPAARVYSSAQARALIARQPGAWVGHTLLVRGILEGPFVFCGELRPCPPSTLGLIDSEDQMLGPESYLPVSTEAEALPLRLLRQIPLLRSFVPAPQPLQFGRMAVYTLRLVAAPVLCSRNPAVLCYAGVVIPTA